MTNTADIYRPSGEIEKYFIRSVWRLCEYNIQERTETILPKGTVEIIFNLSDDIVYCNSALGIRMQLPACFINGLNFKPFNLIKNGQQVFLGIQLNTLGLKVLFNIPVKEFNNRIFEGSEVCKSLATLSHQLFYQKSFNGQVQNILNWVNLRISISNCTGVLNRVHRMFFSQRLNDMTVRKLSSDVYLSDRQLRRLSAEWLGMNTEDFLLYSRYLVSLNLMHRSELSLTQVGLEAGYYDQSHFIREFKSYTELTPKEYLVSTTNLPGHIVR